MYLLYILYFEPLDVLVFVLVNECLSWFLYRYLFMSLLQHLFGSLSRIILASKTALREVKKYGWHEPVDNVGVFP